MNWPGPILTDSGGFQVMSLAKLRKIGETGVTFRSHLDGTRYRADARALDRDPASARRRHHHGASTNARPSPRRRRRRGNSMELSMRWAERSQARVPARAGLRPLRHRAGRRLSAICAGARPRRCAAIGFDGYAVGGLAVGEGQETMFRVLDATVPALPADRPRYLMGVGKPADIVGAVARGIDMFDCVLPTRSGRTAPGLHPARHGQSAQCAPRRRSAAARRRLRLPGLHAATRRAYLHHLARASEILGAMLLT